MSAARRPACFVDRDGTLMVDTHYPSDPAAVRLIPGAADAIASVHAHDVPVIIVTNQGGIARGFLSEAQYEAVRARLEARLADAGATVLATYHCPHWGPVSGPCECRKPATGMYRRAAAEHGLDLARSAYIGDRWRDVQPALDLGGFGVLVPSRETPADDVDHARAHANVAPTLGDAVAMYLASLAQAPARAR